MFKTYLILGLFLLSSIFSATVNIYNINANVKTKINPPDDLEQLPANSVYYFKTSAINNMQMELSVAKDTAINFDVEVHFFETEPTDEEVVEGSIDSTKGIGVTSKDTDETGDKYKYSLPSSVENKEFIVIVVKILQSLENFSILISNGQNHIYSLPYNQEVILDNSSGNPETPLYFKVILGEVIIAKKIAFNVKVKKNGLSNASVSVSGYNAEPDFKDLDKNLIKNVIDFESELSQDGDFDLNKYAVENIEGATYLIIKITTPSIVQFEYISVKVYPDNDDETPKEEESEKEGEKEGESEKEGEKEGEKEEENEKGGEKEGEKEGENEEEKGKRRERDDKSKPPEPPQKSEWSQILIIILSVGAALIIIIILFFIIRKCCCKPKEISSDIIEKDFAIQGPQSSELQ